MTGWRSLVIGVAWGLVAVLIVLGCLSQSLVEGQLRDSLPTPTPTATSIFETTLLPNLPSPTATLASTPTTSPSQTPTEAPSATLGTPGCQPPTGWVEYTVQSGNTLYQLSLEVGVSSTEIEIANCLTSTSLTTGQVIYLPHAPGSALPSPTP